MNFADRYSDPLSRYPFPLTHLHAHAVVRRAAVMRIFPGTLRSVHEKKAAPKLHFGACSGRPRSLLFESWPSRGVHRSRNALLRVVVFSFATWVVRALSSSLSPHCEGSNVAQTFQQRGVRTQRQWLTLSRPNKTRTKGKKKE